MCSYIRLQSKWSLLNAKSNEMYVSAISRKSNEMFLIELPYAKAKDVLANFEQDLTFMVDNLDIVKNRLVILNPNQVSAKKSKSSRKQTRPQE